MSTEVEGPTTTLTQRRQDAFFNDALLFSTAFTAAVVVATAALLLARLLGMDPVDVSWQDGLPDHLLVTGLVVGELFLLWNNGLRQGVRGHSIGMHRVGLRVVDRDSGERLGAGRGLVRGLVQVVLLDLLLTALPFGLPTVLRVATPDAWHVGIAAYLVVAVCLVLLVVPSLPNPADLLARSRVVEATGEDALLTAPRRTVVTVLEVLGVVGLLVVAASYVWFVWPVLHAPTLW
jgi:hypothetical protein